ncbi:MAG: hypothetical protein IJ946_01810 [Clostridia bacterium]|nr:hypothetical protein [Clostridia bacterium]
MAEKNKKRKRTVWFKRAIKHIDSITKWQVVLAILSCVSAVLAAIFSYHINNADLNVTPSDSFWLAVCDAVKEVSGYAMIFFAFFIALSQFKNSLAPKKQKLDYIDFWDERKETEIYGCDDISLHETTLVYGLQAATCTFEESQRLYNRIENLLNDNNLSFSSENLLKCVKAILSVFIKTKRLTKPLSEKDFNLLRAQLSEEYEKRIDDEDLKEWCKIIRKDKLELVYELRAQKASDNVKKELYTEALNLCHDCINLLNAWEKDHPDDEYFVLLYRCYITRNISVINHELSLLATNESDKETHSKQYDEYAKKTLKMRERLLEHYAVERKTRPLIYDYINQEYILALAEKNEIEPNRDTEERILREYSLWEEQNNARNMLLEKISQKVKEINKNKKEGSEGAKLSLPDEKPNCDDNQTV